MQSSHAPTSRSKYHHPYFTSAEIDYLTEQQRVRGGGMHEEKARQQACAFAEAVGARIGFPRKTIAMAQNLYNRFHLFFPRKDFAYHDVILAALYVSAKMNDTLKKPRDLLMVSYAVRYPELAAKSKSVVGEVDMDPAIVEHDRQRLLAVERLILETICFNFTSRAPFPYVIKIGRVFNASKTLTKLAWRLAIDVYRTLMPLQHPPHVIALGCLYTAALLSSFEPLTSHPPEQCAQRIATQFSRPGPWQTKFQAQTCDISDIAHAIIDLLIRAAQNPTANASPSTPSSPAPHLRHRDQHNTQSPASQSPVPYKADQLTQLKIMMRESEGQDVRSPTKPGADAIVMNELLNIDSTGIGRNEGTVRFLFGPPSVVDSV